MGDLISVDTVGCLLGAAEGDQVTYSAEREKIPMSEHVQNTLWEGETL